MCINGDTPQRLGTEVHDTAVFLKEETDRKGKQGHENKMNPGVTFPIRLIRFPQCQKRVSVKKTLLQGAWKVNLFVW